jgi:Zn-dependent protease
MIQIDPAVYFWLAGLFLFLPLDWVLSAITAALLHEFCHMAVLRFLGGKIQKIRIATGGCLIESSPNGKWQAMLSILAGPMGSLSLLFFRSFIPKIAVCGLIQGAYNLLPLLPLDGGNALQILLYSLCPAKADGILLWTGRVVCILFFFGALWLEPGKLAFLISTIWIIRLLPRKIPCKPSEIGVQWS